MPPKVQHTKEEIIEAGFSLVRKEGIDALSARRVARLLNCTARPIYHHFKSMDELKAAVIHKAGKFSVEFFMKEKNEDPFVELGLGYIRFAKKEEQLFKLIYLTKSEDVDYHEDRIQPFLERYRAHPRLQHLSNEQLISINLKMWIFSHGLASLMLIDAITMNMEEVAASIKKTGWSYIDGIVNQ